MPFFIEPDIKLLLANLGEEQSKMKTPEAAIGIKLLGKDFPTDEDLAYAKCEFVEWKSYYNQVWGLIDPTSSVDDQIKQISEHIFANYEDILLHKSYAAFIGRVRRTMACWAVLYAATELMLQDVFTVMERESVSFMDLYENLGSLNLEAKTEIEQIYQKTTIFILSQLILIGTKEDILKVFFHIVQETFEIKGGYEAGASKDVLSKEGSNVFNCLYAESFADASITVVSNKNTSDNFIIKLTWNDGIAAFLEHANQEFSD